MKYHILLFILLTIAFNDICATHNKSGEITYRQIDEFSIECTVTTYTNTIGVNLADRDSLEIYWGDGTMEILLRVNGLDSTGNGIPDGEELVTGIKENKYVGMHTYIEFGSFLLSMRDLNRNGNILNINDGASVSVPFYIETEFILGPDFNSSPNFLLAPVDNASTASPFIHISNAYDIDGDSLSYAIVTPKQDFNEPVPNYQSLAEVADVQGTSFSFNEDAGIVWWDRPFVPGEYVITIEIRSFRNGVQNGRMIRDMAIIVIEEEITIPGLAVPNYEEDIVYPISAGDLIEINFESEDLNSSEIELLAESELFDDLMSDISYQLETDEPSNKSGKISWHVSEENIRPEPYGIVVGSRSESLLANLRLIRFSSNPEWTGVSGFIVNKSFSIFPNPTRSNLDISLPVNPDQEINYYLFTENGKVVLQSSLDKYFQVDLTEIEQGRYWLYIEGYGVKPVIKL